MVQVKCFWLRHYWNHPCFTDSKSSTDWHPELEGKWFAEYSSRGCHIGRPSNSRLARQRVRTHTWPHCAKLLLLISFFFVCRLDRINDNIVRLPCLAVLNASYNNLNYISANFFLTSLRVLNIGFNKLEKLEAAIGSVPPPPPICP